VLRDGALLPRHDVAVLVVWAAVLVTATASTFRWE